MRKSAVVAGAATAVVAGALVVAPPAQAAERFSVRVVDAQVFGAEYGTITSNIPDCPTGRSYTLSGVVQDRAGVFRGTREFVCDSGVGSVTVILSARFGEGGSVGTWSIVTSSGDLSGVHGAGKLAGTPIAGGISDVYTGTVSVTG